MVLAFAEAYSPITVISRANIVLFNRTLELEVLPNLLPEEENEPLGRAAGEERNVNQEEANAK